MLDVRLPGYSQSQIFPLPVSMGSPFHYVSPTSEPLRAPDVNYPVRQIDALTVFGQGLLGLFYAARCLMVPRLNASGS